MSLAALLNPASVAVIGASANPDKIGGRPIHFMKQQGFAGRIYPVNPGRDEVQGLRCYPTLDALPEAPDAAIVAVAGEGTVAAVEACAKAGVKACVIMASGFGETGAEGKAAEARMRAVAHEAGMRLVGPNSQGLANFNTGAILSFSTMFIEEPPKAGPVACLSQSGAMSVVPYGLLRARGIGVGHCHATGNDCDVTVSELAAEVVQDPAVKLVTLYLETLQDPWNLARAARIARERGVPIIALKSGRSPEGARAAASHTGAIASEDRVVDAFLEQHGIWRAEGTEAMVGAVEMYLKGWQPEGRRVAVISNSGATCVLSVDAARRHGLEVAQLSDATETALQGILPGFASARNPVDITAALLTNSGLFGQVLPVAGADAGVDMFLIGIPVSGKGYDFPRFAEDTARFVAETGKPVAIAAPQPVVRRAFAEKGVPVFETEDAAIRALHQLAAHWERMRAAEGRVERQGAPAQAPTEQGAFLDENASLAMAEGYGLRVARRMVCRDAEQAVRFAAGLSGGVVLKAVSAALPHKSEHGLVSVGVEGADAVRAGFAQIRDRVSALGVAFEGVLVAEMVRGTRELVVGGRNDPVFGPVVVVGDGGVLVEAMPDNVLMLAPMDRETVRQALGRLRIAPLFEGVRGQPPLAIEAVIDAVLGMVKMLEDEGPSLLSAEVNPLIVSESGAVAVDALVQRADGIRIATRETAEA